MTVVLFAGMRFQMDRMEINMKQYKEPLLEIVKYKTEECLLESSGVKKSGEYNVELDLPNWNEELI